MDDEVKVSQRYRELGAEEPPRALDDAILAAARRAVDAGPVALSVRGSRQRWYAPLATAAVLVLAIAVTLHTQRERPEIESSVPQAGPPVAVQAPAKEVRKAEDIRPAPVPAVPTPAPAPARAPAARGPQPFAAGAQAKPADDAGIAASVPNASRIASADSTGPAERMERADRPMAQARMPASKESGSPEQELERIAVLRAQGRHEEADKALAEFRKRYPDFRIPEATLQRVERR